MRYILAVLLILSFTGCAIKTQETELRIGTDNLLYGSGTIIGVSVGISETHIPVKATVGYEKYEFISKPKNDPASIDVESIDIIGVTGTIIERRQRARFGDLNQEDIHVFNSRKINPEP